MMGIELHPEKEKILPTIDAETQAQTPRQDCDSARTLEPAAQLDKCTYTARVIDDLSTCLLLFVA